MTTNDEASLSMRARWLLAAVSGTFAGAVRAIGSWILDQMSSDN